MNKMSRSTSLSAQAAVAKYPLSPFQQIVSAGTGAVLVSFFTTPFDVVKVRLQAHQKTGSALSSVRGLCELCFCGMTNAVRTEALTMRQLQRERHGAYQMVKTIAVGEGVQHLWRGLSAALAMSIPATVIYYTAYDKLIERSGFNQTRSNMLYPLVCGSTSRSMAVVAICPIEMLRTKMQSQALGTHRSMLDVLRQAVQVDGVWSLWRGLYPMLLRDVPFSAIYWGSYEWMKTRTTSQGRPISTMDAFGAGAVAGTFAALVTNPFDVVKTYWQVDVGEVRCKAVPQHPPPSASMYDCLKLIVADHGARGLFAGLVPRVIKVAPACAIMISTYEFSKAFFRESNSRA